MTLKAISLSVFVAVLTLTAVVGDSFAQVNPAPYVGNEVVVKLNQTSDLNAITQQYGLSPVPLGQIGD